MDLNIVSILGDVLHVAIAAPLFAVGVVVGVVGYRWLLKNEPALLNGLVSSAYSDLQKALASIEAKAGSAVKPAATTTTTTTTTSTPMPAATGQVTTPVPTPTPVPTATTPAP